MAAGDVVKEVDRLFTLRLVDSWVLVLVAGVNCGMGSLWGTLDT